MPTMSCLISHSVMMACCGFPMRNAIFCRECGERTLLLLRYHRLRYLFASCQIKAKNEVGGIRHGRAGLKDDDINAK